MTELDNKIINLQALDVQTLGHYCYWIASERLNKVLSTFVSLNFLLIA